MGVSGGEEGARHGPSIMVGGPRAAYDRVEDVLLAYRAKYEGEPCCAWLGPDGAGHFVKTIHNGIEYGDMQMIAEIYGILRDGLGMTPGRDEQGLRRMEQGAAQLLSHRDHGQGAGGRHGPQDGQADRRHHPRPGRSEGHRPLGRHRGADDGRSGDGDRGRGRRARAFRPSSPSARRPRSVYGEIPLAFAGDDRDAALKKLELALLAGKVAAYAQGFAVMRGASDEFGWDLPMATIARIWRAGCIIRSRFLDTIASAFEDGRDIANLLVASRFVEMMKDAQAPLRDVVSLSGCGRFADAGPFAALAYFDGYRQSRGTANLIQAQRDFFGAHGFERIDAEGEHHGPWGATRDSPAERADSVCRNEDENGALLRV